MFGYHAAPMRRRALSLLIPLLLLGLTLAVYWPVGRFGFVELDDPYYVYDNAALASAHGTAALRYAFTTFTGGNYHPLVWLSYLFDRWACDLRPGPMHVENAALHAVSSVLVFLLLADATGRVGRAAVCAAVFAVHPAHVESIAWISERKDALSTVWLLAAACAYVRFARTARRRWYAALIGCYALSLSAKSMGVTLPFVLLLLDIWPLSRNRAGPCRPEAAAGRDSRDPRRSSDPSPPRETPAAPATGRHGPAMSARRVLEKLPLFAMAAAASVVAYVAQRSVGATAALATTPAERLGNAALSAVRYVGELFWPVDLAVLYPFRPVPPAAAVASAALLLAVTAAALRFRARRPYLLVGWLWFAGTLLPVSGVVQIGLQAMADRYVYFPSIGLSVAVVWLLADLLAGHRWLTAALATTAITALTFAGYRQVGYWRDTRTLLARAVDVTDGNYLALNGLALGAMRQGDLTTAVRDLNAALDARPDFAPTYANLGRCLLIAGRPAGARSAYQSAVRLAPGDAAYRARLAEAMSPPHDRDPQ